MFPKKHTHSQQQDLQPSKAIKSVAARIPQPIRSSAGPPPTASLGIQSSAAHDPYLHHRRQSICSDISQRAVIIPQTCSHSIKYAKRTECGLDSGWGVRSKHVQSVPKVIAASAMRPQNGLNTLGNGSILTDSLQIHNTHAPAF
jgi:hypothetical protein